MSLAEATVTPVWNGPGFAAEQLAAALGWGEKTVREALSAFGSDPDGPIPLTGSQKVGLAVAAALHDQAGLALQTAAAILRGRSRICDSVLATLDFVPPAGSDGRSEPAEGDPFMLFTAYAGEAVAVPAIDEFIDVMDGRRICWRRPRSDAYRLACELHRLSAAVRKEDTPALQKEYLELLSSLRGPVDHISEWIGAISGNAFRPAPDRFAEAFPAMRQGLDQLTDSRFGDSYAMRVSVNISLAARSFKRRMLGLRVADPFAGGSPGRESSEGAPAR